MMATIQRIDASSEWFPSPYGDIFLKFPIDRIGTTQFPLFPSPYGDIFLKYSRDRLIMWRDVGFRPLTGIFF